MSDWYKNHINNKKEIIVRDGESSSEDEVYCPHCGEETEDLCDIVPDRACDVGEIDCSKCGKIFFLKWEPCYSTSIRELDL